MASTHRARHARHLPALGTRGGGWVAGQVVLIAAVLLSALTGRGWDGPYAPAGYAAGAALLGLGLLLLVLAALQLGTSLTPFPAPKADAITRTGTFELVRHPMYGGGILIALGWTIIFASVLGLGLTLVLSLFLDLKSRREEVWLRDRYDDYEAYCKQTPRKLIPFVY